MASTTTETQAALDIEVFRSAEAFQEAAPAWRALAARIRNPFLAHEWHETYWRSLGEGTPEIVLVRDGGQPLALAPLTRRADGALWFSGDDLTDVLDVLAARAEGLDAVASHLARAGTALELRFIPEGSPTLAILPRVLAAAGFAVEAAPLVVSPRVSLATSFEEQVSELGKKDRHELRRKMRRLEAAGAPSFAWVDDLDASLGRFVSWHRRAPGEKAEFLTTARERFFRELARAGAPAGWLRIGELRIDGRAIAVLFALEWDGTLAAYNAAVDPDAVALSPGILLHAYAMRDAIGRGLATYDLLRGDEPYKYDLGARDQVLWRISARTSGAGGAPTPARRVGG